MSADLLREAAAKMRENANNATPGPWEDDDSTPAPSVYSPTADEYVTDPTNWNASCGDTAHVASWHPAVALAVADWLDSEADNDTPTRRRAITVDGAPVFRIDPQALTVARTYLGRDA